MTNKFQIQKSKVQSTNYKLLSSDGYIAMFSFLTMSIIVGSLITIFTILVSRNTFMARTNTIELENVYALEGFTENILERVKDGQSITDGENLTVGNAVVTVSTALEGNQKRYNFNSQIQNKYSHGQTLLIDSSNPANIKIKEWKESQ